MKGGKYEQWIEALVVVAFDIDEGQKVSHSIPILTPIREKTISMLAFPDSNSVAQYEGIFKYLFKTEDDTFGFVCFKQKKDPTNKRGYSQKSFVVMTKLPFLVFFQKLAEFLVFKLFTMEDDTLKKELEKIKGQAQKWPDPQPLSSFILPVLDYEISIEIPNYVYDFNGTGLIKMENFHSSRKQKKISLEAIVTQESLLQFGRFQQVKLTDHFSPAFEQLWILWQNIILNRPFLIMADNPYKASQAVLAAISLLNPLQYAGDFYPYVTVYDTHLSALQVAQQNLVFGATNPLFLKLFAGSKIKVLQLGNCKIPKHLRPLRQLFVQSKVQQQKFVNQSALRKYFYKVNCGIISILEEYTEMQTNDLKFFNEKQFLRFVRKRQGENILTQLFDSKKSVQIFWQQFVKTLNFAMLLRGRNIVREKS